MADKTIEEFAARLPPEQAAILAALRKLIKTAAPKSEESVKWARPVYSSNGPMIFIKPAKAHLTFGFWRGVDLKDPQGLLEGDGDRMRHVKVKSVQDIDQKQYQAWVKQAVQLNKAKGDPTMARKR